MLKTAKHIRNLFAFALFCMAVFHWPYVSAVGRKISGKKEFCPYGKLLKAPWTGIKFAGMQEWAKLGIHARESDPTLNIQKFTSGTRPFWIKRDGLALNGKSLLAYVIAEEDLIAADVPGLQVRPGDIVVDVGAHIGTFGDDALRRGARKVVMVEPDPVNVECIRRNFPAEIADGRVAVIPEGAWSSPGTLKFSIGLSNSGTGSFVVSEQGARVIEARVRPLDDILRDAGIGKVDYIKMDIEGAEREALKGAAQTLRTYSPRLMLDAYHLPDDQIVIPSTLHAINPAYRSSCGPCSVSGEGPRRVAPFAVFFSTGNAESRP